MSVPALMRVEGTVVSPQDLASSHGGYRPRGFAPRDARASTRRKALGWPYARRAVPAIPHGVARSEAPACPRVSSGAPERLVLREAGFQGKIRPNRGSFAAEAEPPACFQHGTLIPCFSSLRSAGVVAELGGAQTNVIAGVFPLPLPAAAKPGAAQARLEEPLEIRMHADEPIIRVEIATRVPILRQAGFRHSVELRQPPRPLVQSGLEPLIRPAVRTGVPACVQELATGLPIAPHLTCRVPLANQEQVPEGPLAVTTRRLSPPLPPVLPVDEDRSALRCSGWAESRRTLRQAELARAPVLFPMVALPCPNSARAGLNECWRGEFIHTAPQAVDTPRTVAGPTVQAAPADTRPALPAATVCGRASLPAAGRQAATVSRAVRDRPAGRIEVLREGAGLPACDVLDTRCL